MDELDREILDVLKQDGRRSFTDIAERVEVSEGTVRNRVEDMKERGVIERFTVETSQEGMSAVVMVSVSTGKSIEKVFESFPEGIEAQEVTGDFDIIVKLERPSIEELNSQLDEIRGIEGVEETRTYSVLRTRRT